MNLNTSITMNSLFSPTPLLPPLPFRLPSLHLQPPKLHLHLHSIAHFSSPFRPHCTSQSQQPDGTVTMVNFEDLHEKDWSFLEPHHTNQHTQASNSIISEANIEPDSRVLVSVPSEEFVDRLVESSKCKVVLVVHDSLFVLAGIKEKYDGVKCWQGELIYVPEKWGPFDVVFLCYLPALPFQLDEIFSVVEKRCAPGARLIISIPQGREMVEQQRKEYPDVAVADLPHKTDLEKVAADHSFEIVKYIDDPGFYLVVLKYQGQQL